MDRLASSLKQRGQAPADPRSDGTTPPHRYIIVIGERRWRRQAGRSRVARVPRGPRDSRAGGDPRGPARGELRPRRPEAGRAGPGLPVPDAEARPVATRPGREARRQPGAGHAGPEAAGAAGRGPGIDRRRQGAPTVGYEIAKVADPAEQIALAERVARGEVGRNEIRDRTVRPAPRRNAGVARSTTGAQVHLTTPGRGKGMWRRSSRSSRRRSSGCGPRSPAERDAREFELASTLAQVLIVTRGYTAPEARAAAERARELAEKSGDLALLVAQVFGVWRGFLGSGDHATAALLADRMLDLAQREGSPRASASHAVLRCRCVYFAATSPVPRSISLAGAAFLTRPVSVKFSART